MDGGAFQKPRNISEVFTDYEGRRKGLIKALTTDVEQFYQQCDPEKENLCLYGYPNEEWEVKMPPEMVPLLGIELFRDDENWLLQVAAHSDAWLLSVAFYFTARLDDVNKKEPLAKRSRQRLFNKMNNLPTILEIVTPTTGKKQVKEKSFVSNQARRSKLKRAATPEFTTSMQLKDDNDDGGDLNEEEDDALCGSCGKSARPDEFWIYCDRCREWFHGMCVNITSEKAELIDLYKCPSCSNKRAKKG